jgi:hypothetical protein
MLNWSVMKIGDKVRVKENFVCNTQPVFKGMIGTISDVDFIGDVLFIEFESVMVKIGLTEFPEHMELIRSEVGQKCPDALKDWYKATQKYIGMKHE